MDTGTSQKRALDEAHENRHGIKKDSDQKTWGSGNQEQDRLAERSRISSSRAFPRG
jgi:hypothetical protein